MAPQRLNKTCSVEECGRKHAAHGFCLMHYKRIQKYGSPEYSWGGKAVGRPCQYCDRPVVAKELCMRHYQMLHRHGDPLYADQRKVDGLPHGLAKRKGYRTVCPVAEHVKAQPKTDPSIEKSSRSHKALTASQGFRDGSKRNRREWEHRKVAGAKKGDIVHHIDGDPLNNESSNLHIFSSPKDHALAHRSLERVAYHLLRSGMIIFDRQSGLYQLAESVSRSSE